jgi:hypothetical protein
MENSVSSLPYFLVLAKSLGGEQSPSTVKRIRMPTYDTQGSSAGAARRITEGRSFICRGRKAARRHSHVCEIDSFVEKSEEKEAQAQAPGQALFSERRIVGDTHRPLKLLA